MVRPWLQGFWVSIFLMAAMAGQAQLQSCPVNINFATGNLSAWSASTGLIGGQSIAYPSPNAGVTTIPEYSLSIPGIRVNTGTATDFFGKFATVPTVNGYAYNYSVQLGSTAISHDLGNGNPNPGGFTRAISYTINVPAGPSTVPFTMTYAYALVLENGTHNSSEQPLFQATLQSAGGVITCASPQYYLPTLNNGTSGNGGTATGATLDSARALANGFTNSPEFFLSFSGQNNPNGQLLQDVWTKDWTEVTFDLSPYRGQQVTLTFESHNCRPGGHFAYAYVALRNTCAGLEISGPLTACTNNEVTYSVPALSGGSYSWDLPAGWTASSGTSSNIIHVTPGTGGGYVIAHQSNSCANLIDTIEVSATAPTIAGQVTSDNTVCAGNNSTLLSTAGSVGTVVDWLSSPDGSAWTALGITSGQYTATNLESTTHYTALVQNGSACRIDSAAAVVITVDPRSNAGVLQPATSDVCAGQISLPVLQLNGSTGSVVRWQLSADNAGWTDVSPPSQQLQYQPASVNATTYYRAIVASGVCASDTGDAAVINYFNTAAPVATLSPDSVSICHGEAATLAVNITTGSSYSWNSSSVTGPGNGTTGNLPFSFNATANPRLSTDLVLTVRNAGCPVSFSDTVHVNVAPQINVYAGNDTSVVVGQTLQLNAISSLAEANSFTWSPSAKLSSATIADPTAIYNNSDPEYFTYRVTASTADGCEGADNITVTVFKTGSEIFIPGAFTPNGDGHNDEIIPVVAGIRQLGYFRIYNRWGQLVFSTSAIGRGWDGRINGVLQAPGNFVYMVQAVDHTGKVITRKGNLLLIR